MTQALRHFKPDQLLEPKALRAALKVDDISKRDLRCSMSQVEFVARDTPEGIRYYLDFEKEGRETQGVQSGGGKDNHKDRYQFGSWAFIQFCKRVKTPPNYILKCPAHLARQNNGWWMRLQENQELLVRYRERTPDVNSRVADAARKLQEEHEITFRVPPAGHPLIRGVCNASYSIFDNRHLLDAIMPMVEKHDLAVIRFDTSDHDFHVKLIFRENINVGTAQKKDDVNVGVHIANSEVGGRKLTIDFMIFRLVCSNGMIAMVDGDRLLTQAHAHIPSRTEFGILVENAFDKLLQHKDAAVNRFAEARRITYKKPLMVLRQAMIDLPGGNLGLYEKVKGEWEFGHREGWYGNDKFSLVNAITRIAQDFATQDRMVLEGLGGAFLMSTQFDEKD